MSIQLNGTNGIQFDDGSNMSSANQLGWRNRIINGDMRIDQRNAGAAVTVDGSYPVDRFTITNVTDATFSASRSTTAPTGFTNSLYFTVTAADASLSATQRCTIKQVIEGVNIADFGWGTADAQPVTLSFRVRSSLTGTFGGSAQNSDGTRGYPFTYTINSANTWETKTVTIAGDTTGTWLTDNGIGITINFGLGVGSTYSGTAGAWAGADYRSATGATSVVGTNGATFYITGVQLEKGSVATPFEYVDYGEQLRRCQRYYWQEAASPFWFACSAGQCTSSTEVAILVRNPVPMRATCTPVTTGAVSDYGVQAANGAGITLTGVATSTANSSGFRFEATVASGLVAGNSTILYKQANSPNIGASAEL